jgi:ribosome recycling factor
MKEQILAELRENMEKTILSLEKSFSKVRTGRASLSLLDGIRVEYYGTLTPLNQLASLSIPESRMILISPWDSSVLGAIEKAILKSDLGLMPSNDGKLIRLAIPVLTEERRKELVKVVRKTAEEFRIKQRNLRRDSNERIKTLKKNNDLSEDEQFAIQEEIQKVTDSYIVQTDKLLAAKEKEIMEI